MSDAPAPKSVFRSYCFTLNNYTEVERLVLLHATCRYVIIGKEVGESGTPHLQGYIVFSTEKSLKQVRQLCPRSHWEGARGSALDSYTYCSKEGDFEERGTRPMSSKEKGLSEIARWDLARSKAKEGKLDEIPSDIYLRYYRTLKEVAKDHMVTPADAEDLTGVWIHGPAGCGKSRKARVDYPLAYLKMCNKWWDGYQGEDHVIIDDVDSKHDVLGHHLKIWADRYAFLAETKGGAQAIRPKTIVVTSQYSIEDIWPDVETRDALRRRFTVINMTSL